MDDLNDFYGLITIHKQVMTNSPRSKVDAQVAIYQVTDKAPTTSQPQIGLWADGIFHLM